VTAVLAVAALAGMYRAYDNVVHYFVRPSTAEVRYVRRALMQSDLKKYEVVHFIVPELSEVSPRWRLDEFGNLTFTSKAHRVPQMVTIIQTIPASARSGPLRLSFSSEEEFRGADEKTLVIDMTWMRSIYSDHFYAEP
jgi:hypothetical protein